MDSSSTNNANGAIPAIIRKKLMGYVGFANLPNQVHRKSVRKGFQFTAMVVGESGLGKSTLINTLFNTTLYPPKEPSPPSSERPKTVAIESISADIEENGVRLRLTVVDTPGFGDFVNNDNSWKPILENIETRFDTYLEQENRVNRQKTVDNRVHACLYFIQPTGHSLKQIDIEFMRRLHQKVNLIPIIAKADTLTDEEIANFKQRVLSDISHHNIEIFQAPVYENEDEETLAENEEIAKKVPFAVVGSNVQVETPDGRTVRGRAYPWGVIEVDNEEHCDFVKLRQMLVRTYMEELREKTDSVLYEKWRSEKLLSLGVEQDSSVFKEINPALRMAEERSLHEQKLAKMETEMKSVFTQKVQEKETKLKQSEEELYARHKEMKESLEKQRLELEDKKRRLESGRPLTPTERSAISMSLAQTPESQVLAALEVFSSATDKDAIDRANSWLLDFQHSTEAWSTANNLLLAPDTLPHARLFAAQTFRAKVIYDLTQIPSTQYIPLRDTLITAMHSISQSGPKTVITQLCLALSGLALQTPLLDIIDVMLKTFGQTPEGVAVLLEFLTVFPEELSENTRIPVSPEEYRERMSMLLTDHTSKILDLLTVYIQSPAATLVIQNQIFKCLRSWLNTGQVMAISIGETPLLPFAFEALSSDELFDSAVDVICDIIHETQEIEENMSVIHAVVPRVIALKPLLRTYHDDAEKIKGYSKIFAEAGETYRVLLLQNSQDFLPILEAIVECTAYSDLDIVPMTFSFWWRLSQSIGKRSSVPPVLIEVYSTLVDIIIKHLHFPTDPTSMSAQETDDFRSFRHVMGDTLKDCCHVLGTDKCLVRAYEMIVANLAADKGWQAIEAPLFSMRSMGAEMDPLDDQIIPKIMDLLPQLPHHPRVRYAALLVVSRYTEWTSHHPSYIPFQLQYISAGFDEANSAPDAEVPAAAGLAMKYLCKDCRQHLVSYIPQLHSFLNTIGTKLNHEDQLQLYEAVAYVISSMPMREATQTLHTFCTGVLAKIHLIVNKPTLATKDELQTLSNSLEHLETMLYVVKGFGDELPQDCQKTCQEAWSLFDTLLSKYGDSTIICDRATRVLRHGIDLCGTAALPIVPQVLSRMTTSFGAWGHAGYVWIAGKVMARFGTDADETLRQIFRQAYEGLTSKLFTLMQTVLPMNMPDVLSDTSLHVVIEDYVRMTLQMFDFTPDILLLSPQFPTSFAACTAGLALVQPEINYVCLDFIRAVVSHDSLRVPPPGEVTPSNHPLYAQAIRATFAAQGSQLLGFLLSGLVTEFDEDACPIESGLLNW
ncbi:hypothetical protein Clacol_008087 [Clathrus columnatus]|uniref:Septin-type G domain-containing protein n=1 Tax=Clathrus columnatus TaxID=1419009 RepID=A0AAV5AHJ2_9AGAM|nr:hypothetical protein Clacol_008087 [Clathrus columnatus]